MLCLATGSMPLPSVIQEHAKLTIPLAQLELLDCQWDRPMRAAARFREHMLFMSLTAPPRNAQLRCEWLDGRYHDAGPLGLIPAGTALWARSEGGEQRILTCRIQPAQFDEVVTEPIQWDTETRLAAMDLRCPHIRSTFSRIAMEILSPGMASRTLIEALCVSLIVDVGRYLGGNGQACETGKLMSWQLRRIEERARTVEGQVPTLAEVASLCQISVRQLIRQFKASTGKTVQQYFVERQMDVAKSLLANSEMALKAIAFHLGFKHPASFTMAFARACGETPSSYRLRNHSRRICA
jgi:AraC family transcriptional regulator